MSRKPAPGGVTRALGALVLAAALTAGCTDDGGGTTSAPTTTAAAVTVRVEVADAARTDAVAKVVEGRLRAFGAAPVSSDTEAGAATFGLARRLTVDEESALAVTGHLVFRPVLETMPPGPGCATPSPTRTDDAKDATACAQGGDARYELGPAVPGIAVASARADDGMSVEGVSTGEWNVEVTLSDAAAWLALTEKYVEKQIAIVLDGVVQSAPIIAEPIPSGVAVISGTFTEARARALAAVLSGGTLPAQVTVTQTG